VYQDDRGERCPPWTSWDNFLKQCRPDWGAPPPNNPTLPDAERDNTQDTIDALFPGNKEDTTRTGTRGGTTIPGLSEEDKGRIVNIIGGLCVVGLNAVTQTQTRTKDRDKKPRYLYHYTKEENVNSIIDTGLNPSIRVPGNPRSDAQWGDGQYLTDLTPEESSTVTRFQHSYALFKIPWKWGRAVVAWIKVDTRGLQIQRAEALFGSRFPHRSIYLNPSGNVLLLTGRSAGTGVVNFAPSPSGIR
jgi:hypothetical protein